MNKGGTRVYAIRNEKREILALVRAGAPSTAMSHYAARTLAIDRPSADEVYACAVAGMKIEDAPAGAAPETGAQE